MFNYNHLHLSYALWKQAVTYHGFAYYHLVETSGSTTLFSGSNASVITATVNDAVDSDEYDDWDTNFEPTSTEVSYFDDGTLRSAGCCSLREIPREHDGKVINALNSYEEGLNLYVASRGDTLSNVADGTHFYTGRSTTGTTEVNFFFRDWVQLGGGQIWYENFKKEDYVTLKVIIPETDITTNESNEGNVNVISNIIVPADNDGTHDLVLTDGIPIVSSDNTGYWSWDWPNAGKGTITPAPAGDGNIHLSDIAYDMKYMNFLHLIGSGESLETFFGVLPKKILPQWSGRFTLYTSGSHTVNVSWSVVCARFYST